MSAPLRIGVLGASRIAKLAVVDAARETGDVLAAVAARDPERAAAFAREHGVAGTRADYEELIADDSLDLVYIGLPNGLHAEWTARALAAGRDVLVEKPFAANLAEFERVEARLGPSRGWAFEAFHYADHPAFARALELLGGPGLLSAPGELGALRSVRVTMHMPAPKPSDPRWSFELAGGAMMDLGCYALNALIRLGESAAFPDPVAPRVLRAAAVTATAAIPDGDPRVDAAVRAELALGDVPATIDVSMAAEAWDFGLELACERGAIRIPNFVKPQEDDRLIVTLAGGPGGGDEPGGGERVERVERTGGESSYAHQLRRVREELRAGARDRAELARSRRTAALIDEVYAAAGLPERPARLMD
ncbi:Gfo/Idh/MocA family protein [Leucobacter luti]|uniref:Gfo/Idh/MocA family protein n=1 Tax=Leucobacter luti TaxID=340320 RepID=UPI003D03720E